MKCDDCFFLGLIALTVYVQVIATTFVTSVEH